jgi:hypothetical protein
VRVRLFGGPADGEILEVLTPSACLRVPVPGRPTEAIGVSFEGWRPRIADYEKLPDLPDPYPELLGWQCGYRYCRSALDDLAP